MADELLWIEEKIWKFEGTSISLHIHLFVKVSQPGNSEGAFSVFESSCHLLLPV